MFFYYLRPEGGRVLVVRLNPDGDAARRMLVARRHESRAKEVEVITDEASRTQLGRGLKLRLFTKHSFPGEFGLAVALLPDFRNAGMRPLLGGIGDLR